MIPHGSLVSRGAALGLLTLVLALVWLAIAEPLVGTLTGTATDEREKAITLLARYEAVIAERPALQERLKTLQTTSDNSTGLAAGPTPAVAAASLQGELKNLIEAVGGEIRSVQILPVEKVEEFEKLSLQYELNVPQQSMQRLLSALKAHRTILIIESLRLRVPESVRVSDAADTKISGQWIIASFRRASSDAR
jgi:hypothetical protein